MDDAPATGTHDPYRPHPHRPGYRSHGRRRLVGLSWASFLPGVDGRGCRGEQRPASLVGKRTPTAACSTIWACACFTAWRKHTLTDPDQAGRKRACRSDVERSRFPFAAVSAPAASSARPCAPATSSWTASGNSRPNLLPRRPASFSHASRKSSSPIRIRQHTRRFSGKRPTFAQTSSASRRWRSAALFATATVSRPQGVAALAAILFGADLPANPPWDPIPEAEGAARAAVPVARPCCCHAHVTGTRVTVDARKLQASSQRPVWKHACSTCATGSPMSTCRSWYPIFILMPYFVIKSYERLRASKAGSLIDSLSQGSRDLEIMSRLLDGPMQPWIGETAEEGLRELGGRFLGILSFFRTPASSTCALESLQSPGKTIPTSLVLRWLPAGQGAEAGPDFPQAQTPFQYGCASRLIPKTQIRFPHQELQPKLQMKSMESTTPGEKMMRTGEVSR